MEMLMKRRDSVHHSLSFVYFVDVDEASWADPSEKVVFSVVVGDKLRNSQQNQE